MGVAPATRQRSHRILPRRPPAPALPKDPLESARVAGLRYVSDDAPGLRRKRSGKGFTYLDVTGARIRDAAALERIRRLAIPPAWTDVWICPSADGHLQATGRDARGRKQYRYHPTWMALRSQTKYDRLLRFGMALGEMRKRTEEDLARRGLPREKVLATVVRLLERTFIRVGNAEYTKQNNSFGLTTLRDQHVDVDGPRVRFEFRGKSGVAHAIELTDPRLARIVARCKDIPGYELFQYLDDDGGRQRIDSGEVNAYLRALMGEDFTAKDFRTWAGTVQTATTLAEMGPAETAKEARAAMVESIKRVAARLGNTPAMTRTYYVHPVILEAYEDGTLLPELERCRARPVQESHPDLGCEEIAVLSLLEKARARPAGSELASALARSLRSARRARRPRRATVPKSAARAHR